MDATLTNYYVYLDLWNIVLKGVSKCRRKGDWWMLMRKYQPVET